MNNLTERIEDLKDLEDYRDRFTIVLSVAEMGVLKEFVDSLPLSRNKTEQKRTARIVLTMLVQLYRAAGNVIPTPYAALISYTAHYVLEEDDLFYTFIVEFSAMKPIPPKEVPFIEQE